ncbi:MAG: response regulator, partial [Solirubrobacteraceae bacterium]
MQAEQLDVIVVDDHLTVRRGIELVLAEAGFRIVGAGGSLAEAETLLSRRRFDVALLDAQLGDDSVIALVESVLREHPRASIVLYTGHTGPESELSQAARAGARGFVLKSSPGARLTG